MYFGRAVAIRGVSFFHKCPITCSRVPQQCNSQSTQGSHGRKHQKHKVPRLGNAVLRYQSPRKMPIRRMKPGTSQASLVAAIADLTSLEEAADFIRTGELDGAPETVLRAYAHVLIKLPFAPPTAAGRSASQFAISPLLAFVTQLSDRSTTLSFTRHPINQLEFDVALLTVTAAVRHCRESSLVATPSRDVAITDSPPLEAPYQSKRSATLFDCMENVLHSLTLMGVRIHRNFLWGMPTLANSAVTCRVGSVGFWSAWALIAASVAPQLSHAQTSICLSSVARLLLGGGGQRVASLGGSLVPFVRAATGRCGTLRLDHLAILLRLGSRSTDLVVDTVVLAELSSRKEVIARQILQLGREEAASPALRLRYSTATASAGRASVDCAISLLVGLQEAFLRQQLTSPHHAHRVSKITAVVSEALYRLPPKTFAEALRTATLPAVIAVARAFVSLSYVPPRAVNFLIELVVVLEPLTSTLTPSAVNVMGQLFGRFDLPIAFLESTYYKKIVDALIQQHCRLVLGSGFVAALVQAVKEVSSNSTTADSHPLGDLDKVKILQAQWVSSKTVVGSFCSTAKYLCAAVARHAAVTAGDERRKCSTGPLQESLQLLCIAAGTIASTGIPELIYGAPLSNLCAASLLSNSTELMHLLAYLRVKVTLGEDFTLETWFSALSDFGSHRYDQDTDISDDAVFERGAFPKHLDVEPSDLSLLKASDGLQNPQNSSDVAPSVSVEVSVQSAPEFWSLHLDSPLSTALHTVTSHAASPSTAANVVMDSHLPSQALQSLQELNVRKSLGDKAVLPAASVRAVVRALNSFLIAEVVPSMFPAGENIPVHMGSPSTQTLLEVDVPCPLILPTVLDSPLPDVPHGDSRKICVGIVANFDAPANLAAAFVVSFPIDMVPPEAVELYQSAHYPFVGRFGCIPIAFVALNKQAVAATFVSLPDPADPLHIATTKVNTFDVAERAVAAALSVRLRCLVVAVDQQLWNAAKPAPQGPQALGWCFHFLLHAVGRSCRDGTVVADYSFEKAFQDRTVARESDHL